MARRPVIIHYHLFKNAGTSVDRILESNFGDGWAEIEGPDNKKLDPSDLADFIRANPQLKAVSSHTATVSMPDADDLEIIPILFLRHPIDRIRSAYDFERTQDAQTPGAIQAKAGDFKAYLDWRVGSNNPWQVVNFHAMRLKDFHEFTPAKQTEKFLPRAKAAVDALPFIGFVEDFDASMARFAEGARTHFPDIFVESVHANTTSDTKASLERKLDSFRDRIGETTYDRLVELNATDFELYDYARKAHDLASAA